MPIEYSGDELRRIHEAIERFWFDATGEELGIIKRDRVFAFFNNLLGAAGYNRAIADAQAYLQTRMLDMDSDLHQEVRYRPGDDNSE